MAVEELARCASSLLGRQHLPNQANGDSIVVRCGSRARAATPGGLDTMSSCQPVTGRNPSVSNAAVSGCHRHATAGNRSRPWATWSGMLRQGQPVNETSGSTLATSHRSTELGRPTVEGDGRNGLSAAYWATVRSRR